MAFGMTPTGFVPKTTDECIGEMKAQAAALIDPDLVLDADDPVGQILGIVGEGFGDLWQSLRSVVASLDPDNAEDKAQDVVCAITGVTREGETRSLVEASCTLAAGTYAAGSLIARSAVDITARFRNRDALTVAVDGVVSATFEGETPGPITVAATMLTVMVSSIAGWTAVTNPEDAVPGRLRETNDELRVRREDELAASGGSTVDALAVDLLQVLPEGGDVVPLENIELATDGITGLPGKSFEMIVYDGTTGGTAVDDATIAGVIWAGKPSGIASYGAISTVVTDSKGRPRTVKWSRPTVLDAFLEIDLETSTADGWIPGTSEALVATEVAKYGDSALRVGGELILRRLDGPIFKIAGVVDILEIRAGFAPSPSGTVNLTAGVRELIDLDTSRVVVTGS